ncbi:hypothetical protein F511_35909 [Dorcoceras hygrometricum]|uniref:CCHC-type domain-containing protein n=1 Tax=Dorcoceras hygrometricum TaxID=472368 RepID=A0A2Z7B9E6_9LAMI|nr:hypothetical protein F511_35909 [Dorcoceras hygrometricum]
MVLSGSHATYAEDVDRTVDIEESLLEAQAPVQPRRSFQPVQVVSQSFQSPQGSHQSIRQRFKPRGKQFKKKPHSSSSGYVSSGGSSSGGVFCGQCGEKHETLQCHGFRGLCHLFGQPGHFARACTLMGGQSLGQSQQGSAGGSSSGSNLLFSPNDLDSNLVSLIGLEYPRDLSFRDLTGLGECLDERAG